MIKVQDRGAIGAVFWNTAVGPYSLILAIYTFLLSFRQAFLVSLKISRKAALAPLFLHLKPQTLPTPISLVCFLG